MIASVNVQVPLLKECINGRIPVTVFLMNGFRLDGIITNFDTSVIVLEENGKQNMIYKHAISTVVPSTPVKIKNNDSLA